IITIGKQKINFFKTDFLVRFFVVYYMESTLYKGGNLLKKISYIVMSAILLRGLSVTHTTAAETSDESERVIISFNEEIDYKLLEEMGAEIHEEFDSISAVSVTLPDEGIIQSASNESSIEYIEENSEVRAAAQTTTWG